MEISERLRRAREEKKLTQAQAAAKIGIARTTLVAIEAGTRSARTNELRKLANIYGTSVNALLRNEAVHTDLVPKFRKSTNTTSENTILAVQKFSALVKAEVELENLLGVTRVQNLPPEHPLLPGDVVTQAENDARDVRQWLGLAYQPISDIVSLLEMSLGIRVYHVPLPNVISGLSVYDRHVGACILLNRRHPRARRTFTAAHELGHIVSVREEPHICVENPQALTREERYATAFGLEFLMPAQGLIKKFSEVTSGAERLSRRHVILLAHYFGVSREALVRRLEALRRVPGGTWDWFVENGGISNLQAREVLGEIFESESNTLEGPTSLRLGLLAHEALRQGLLSEGQVARLLGIDRVELRKVVGDIGQDNGELDGVPILSR